MAAEMPWALAAGMSSKDGEWGRAVGEANAISDLFPLERTGEKPREDGCYLGS